MVADPCVRTGNVASFFSGERRCSRWAGHRQFLQVVHEDLQTDVIGENRSPCLLLRHKGKTTVKKKKHLSNLKAFLYDIAGLTITLITFLSPRWSHISSEVPFEPHILRICCSLQFKTLRFDSICQRHRKALGFQHSIWMKEGNNASSEINFRTRVLCMKMCGSPNTVPAPSHTGCCESVTGWPWTAGTEPVSHRVLCQRIWAWGNAPARSPRHHPGEPAAAV